MCVSVIAAVSMRKSRVTTEIYQYITTLSCGADELLIVTVLAKSSGSIREPS